jgi:hypothetical protein
MSATRTSVLTAALSTAALAALGTTAPSAAHAQSAQRFSVQASGLAVGTRGEAYEGMKAGPGFELQVRYTPSVWSFGVGAQSSTHSLDDTALGGEEVTLAGAFFEPRRVFDVGATSYAPYASARLAFLRQSIDLEVEGTPVSASASGAQVNLGGGVLFRVSPRVNIDLGATFGVINFGDAKVTVPGFGSVNAGSAGSGQNVVMRAGVAVGF